MKPKRQLNPGETAITWLLFLFSLGIFYQAYTISGFGGINTPGTFPLLASGAMVLSSFSLIISNLRLDVVGYKSGLPVMATLHRLLPSRVLLFCALIVVYMLVLPWLGFIIASILFLLIGMLYLKAVRPWLALVIALIGMAIIYVIFHYLFEIVLPEGRLGDLLQLF